MISPVLRLAAATLVLLTCATALEVVNQETDNPWGTQTNVQYPGAVNLGAALDALNVIDDQYLFAPERFQQSTTDSGIRINISCFTSANPPLAQSVILYPDGAADVNKIKNVYGTHQMWPDLWAMALQYGGLKTYLPDLQAIGIDVAFKALTGQIATAAYTAGESTSVDATALVTLLAAGAISPHADAPLPRAPIILQTKTQSTGKMKPAYAYALRSIKKVGDTWNVECLDPVEEVPVAFNEAQLVAGVQIVWVLEGFKPTVSEVVNLVA